MVSRRVGLAVLLAAAVLAVTCTAVDVRHTTSVEDAVRKLVHSSENTAVQRDPLKPIALVPMSEWKKQQQRQTSPSLLEEATGAAPFAPLVCGTDLVCPTSTGTCCGTEFCCPEACAPDGRRCMMSPMSRALAIAQAKMKLEAEVQINSQLAAQSHSERGQKRTAEQGEKEKNESQMKANIAQQQAALVKAETENEAKVKNVKVTAEQGEKQRTLAAEKARADAALAKTKADIEAKKKQHDAKEKQLAAKHAATVDREKHSIKKTNFSPKPTTVCAADGKVQKTATSTWTFWLFPRGKQDKDSELFSGENKDFGLYVQANSFKLRVVSAKQTINLPKETPLNRWVFVVVQRKGTNLRVLVGGEIAAQQAVPETPDQGGKLYCATTDTPPAKAIMSDLRYYPSYLEDAKINAIMAEKNYRAVS